MKRAGLALLFLGLVSSVASAPAFAGPIYDNTTANSNTVNGFSIGLGDWITDSFTLTSNSTAGGITFLVWLSTGDTLTSVDYSIESSAPTVGDDGSQTLATVTGVYEGSNLYDMDVYQETIMFAGTPLTAGTYYLTLQDAVVSNGDDAYWDESDGGATAYADGTSLNNYYGTGTSGSETFQVLSPEPNSLVLLGTGLMLMAGFMAKKLRA